MKHTVPNWKRDFDSKTEGNNMATEIFSRELPLNTDYDVIVAGGGPAGVAAACASAREGAKTLLVESSGMLGGMATKGLVSSWTPVSDGIHVVYGGFAEKVFRDLRSRMPWVGDSYSWVPIDPEWLKTIYDALITANGADLLFHSSVCALEKDSDRHVSSLIVANKSGLTKYRAPVFIDCTGDADIAAWAGNEMYLPDPETCQPGSLCFVIANIHIRSKEDLSAIRDRKNPESALNRIVSDPEFCIPDPHFCLSDIGPHALGLNAGHIWFDDPTDPECLTKSILKGRKIARDFLTGLKKYDPEHFRDAFLAETAPTVGLRESRRIVGDYVFTVEDYLKIATFPDDIGRNKYYIDVHASVRDKPGTISDFNYPRYGTGESHGIPYRILCPKDLDNVLVAGRCVSSDRLSQGSLRVMPSCLVMGEAAGIAAALASRKETPDIHCVDVPLLQKLLRSYGAFLPE